MHSHSFRDPHPRRCETCRKDVMNGDRSCPIFVNGPRPWDDEKQNDMDLIKECGCAVVITRYVGCSTWKTKKERKHVKI